MWKTIKNRIEEIVSDSLPDFDSIIARKVQEEVSRKWQVDIHTIGENDIVVFPSNIPAEEFDRFAKEIERVGVRGVIAADNVRVIRIE